MERRLQLLLDQERYERVAAEAQRSGRSVAAVIREAIDLRFDDDTDRRRRAAAELLRRAIASSDEPYESAAELKRLWEEDLVAKLPK